MNTLVNVMMSVSAVARDSKLSSVSVSTALWIYLVIKALFIISKVKAISSSTADVAFIDKVMTNGGFAHYQRITCAK